MATITITIPDAVLTRVINGVAIANSYQPMIRNPNDPDGPAIPNPQTRAQFAKAQIIRFVKDSVKQAEAIVAADNAREAATADADLINIT